MKILAISLSVLLFSPCAFAQDGAVGRITYTDGRVDILKEGSSLAVPVREGDEVSVNDALRTKSNSKAGLRFDDGSSLRLGQNSRIEITDYRLDNEKRRKTATIKLDRGKMRAIINKMNPSGGEFNILTPNASGTVTGSDIFAFYQAGSSGMLVAEGKLAVKSLLGPEKPLVVPAGSSAVIDIGGATAGPRPYMAIERKVYEHDTFVPYTLPKKTETAVIKGAFVKISGDVKVSKKGAAPREANYSDVIGEGDRIETGPDAMAEVKFDNGCGLSLKPDTNITITRLVIDPKTREYQNLFESSRGRIKARIENLKDKSVFEIKTPSAICGARGTIMYVDILPTLVRAFFEGGGGYIQNLISGSETLIGMGYGGSSDNQGNASAPAPVTDEERDNWTQGWGGDNGTEGYSAAPSGGATGDLGGGGAGGPTGDTVGGAGGDPANEGGPDIYLPPTPNPAPPSTPAYSLSGVMSGLFGSYLEQDRRLDLTRGSLSGSFSTSGSTSIWGGGSQTFALGGAYMDSGNPYDKLWGGTFSGTTSDGAALLGYSVGIKGSLEALLYAFYVRPDGGSYRTGYIRSGDLIGDFYPGAGVFSAVGTLTSHFDLPTGMLPAGLYLGSPDIRWFGTPEGTGTGRVFGDGFSGTIFTDTTQTERQEQDIELWMAGLGGAWTNAPQGAWNAVVGGIDHWQDEDAYWIAHLAGGAWQNGKFRGRVVSGRDIGYYRTPEHRYDPGSGSWTGTIIGDILGVYDQSGGWQAVGMGVLPTTDDLQFGAQFDGKFGRYDAESQKVVIDYGSFTGLLGGASSLWTGSPHFTIIGEFSNPENRPLWHTTSDINGTTKDGGVFLASMGGIKGSLEGVLCGLYIRPDGEGGYLAGYLKSTDITGEFYPGIGMFEADGTLTRSVNEYSVAIPPVNLRDNISRDNLTGSPDGGSFAGSDEGNEIGPVVSGFIGTMLNISQQTWGVWNFVTNGTYQGPTSDVWDVYDLTGQTRPGATSADQSFIGGSWLGGIGSDTAPGKWSGGEIEGALDAVWIGLRKNGTLSGRKVDGEVVGNYVEVSENQGTWQAGGAGEWIEVNANLASAPGLDANVIALGQAANVPISVAYSSTLTGSNGPITSMTMNTHLFNMAGGGDGIWAAIINGTYSTPPSTNWNVTVANGPDNATLSGPAWANNQWNADVSGTVNSNSIAGKAGGTYANGAFQGAGTGTFESQS